MADDERIAALQSEEGLEVAPGVRVRLRSLADYQQNPENPVSHTPRNLGAVIESIHRVGAGRSGLASKGKILAGNLTHDAMAEAGIEGIIEVTTDGTQWVMVNREDLTPEQEKQAAYGDQQGSFLAGWELDQVLADVEVGVDLEGLVTDLELEAILGEAWVGAETGEAPEPQIDKGAELAEKWGVQVGQVWQLGEHRLACGDCTDKAVVDAVMGGEKAGAVVTDPPYGCTELEWDRYPTQKEVQDWLDIVDKSVVAFGAALPRCLYAVLSIEPCPERIYIWWNTFTLTHSEESFWQWQPIYVWRRSHFQGMDRDVIQMAANTGGATLYHATQKPVLLLEKLVSCTGSQLIYDPFVGSGTTLIACERLGRKCRAIEIEPKYCAITIQRWVDLTGKEPKLLQ